jgi:hypothetical protein
MVVSWSFLKAFEQCPFQQKLIRIDKVVPKKIDERRFIAGAVGHRFFEVWAERGFDDTITPRTVERILYIMSKKKYIVWRDKSDYERVKEKVINEASLIVETVHRHGIDKLYNIQVEKLFTKPLPCNQHLVAGKVDIVANDGAWLLEMKMSAETKWQDPDQLIFYGLLIGSIQRRYPERLTFFLPVMPNVEDRLLNIQFSKNDFLAMYERNLIGSWENEYFPVAGNLETCKYCPVGNYCRKNTIEK